MVSGAQTIQPQTTARWHQLRAAAFPTWQVLPSHRAHKCLVALLWRAPHRDTQQLRVGCEVDVVGGERFHQAAVQPHDLRMVVWLLQQPHQPAPAKKLWHSMSHFWLFSLVAYRRSCGW
jgi:hypothetical protein